MNKSERIYRKGDASTARNLATGNEDAVVVNLVAMGYETTVKNGIKTGKMMRNNRSIISIMGMVAIMLSVSLSGYAQLGGALNKVKDAVKKEPPKQEQSSTQSTENTVQQETVKTQETVKLQETAQVPAAAKTQQPWVVDKEEKGRIHATYADGVLTFKGYGAMKNYRVDIHGDDRPWAAYVKDIKSVVVGDEMTHLGGFLFYGCENLTSISLPATLENIAGSVFFGCQSLKTITLPKSLNFFNGGEVPDPKNMGKTMYAGLFGQCTSLTEIKVADGNAKFKSINGVLYFNFNGELSLAAYPAGRKDATFNVPDKTASIMIGAFSFCEALKTVVLPASCSAIEQVAFLGCTHLESISLKMTIKPVKLGGYVFRDVDMNKVKIHVPKALLEKYTTRGEYGWVEWKEQIIGQ